VSSNDAGIVMVQLPGLDAKFNNYSYLRRANAGNGADAQAHAGD